mmetsp:Transcript_32654/g.112399  ORF Transcript_32654/g.112399 Transcript_32654/m.112399 type:complete len:308 (+) Transcript_32654:515-1438(+)
MPGLVLQHARAVPLARCPQAVVNRTRGVAHHSRTVVAAILPMAFVRRPSRVIRRAFARCLALFEVAGVDGSVCEFVCAKPMHLPVLPSPVVAVKLLVAFRVQDTFSRRRQTRRAEDLGLVADVPFQSSQLLCGAFGRAAKGCLQTPDHQLLGSEFRRLLPRVAVEDSRAHQTLVDPARDAAGGLAIRSGHVGQMNQMLPTVRRRRFPHERFVNGDSALVLAARRRLGRSDLRRRRPRPVDHQRHRRRGRTAGAPRPSAPRSSSLLGSWIPRARAERGPAEPPLPLTRARGRRCFTHTCARGAARPSR